VATDIEMFRKLLDKATAGDNVGVLLRRHQEGRSRARHGAGQTGQASPRTRISRRKSMCCRRRKAAGTRRSSRTTVPQFYFRTTDVTGTVALAAGVEMVMPGDNVSVEITVISPVAMERGQRFAIREGGRTIGAGRVTEVIA